MNFALLMPSFQGTATRKDFWMFQLLSFLVAFGATLSLFIVRAVGMDGLANLGWVALALGMIWLVVAGWSVSTRRCRDLGHSGWMVLLYFVPFVSFLFFLYLGIAPSRTPAT